jgi:hypothetical protein
LERDNRIEERRFLWTAKRLPGIESLEALKRFRGRDAD